MFNFLSNKSIERYTSFLFLLIFLGFYGSATLFYHSHLVNNKIISHSHPFKSNPLNKLPFQSHNHSSDEIVSIQHFNEIKWDNDVQNIVVINIPIEIFNKLNTHLSSSYNSNTYNFSQLRAPPIC